MVFIASKKRTFLVLLGLLAFSQFAYPVKAQGKRVNLDDDLDLDVESQATQSRQKQPQAPIRPASIVKHALEYKFEDEDTWKVRGNVRISKDGSGSVLSVDVDNFDINGSSNLKELMETKCSKNKLYQLRVADFGIQTSIPACHYARSGYNDTLIFHAD